MTLHRNTKILVKRETTYGTNPAMANPLDNLPWITDRPPTEADALNGAVQVLFERTDKSKLIGTCHWRNAVPRSETEFGYYVHGWLHYPDWRSPAPEINPKSPVAAEILINALAAIDTPLTEKQIHAVRYFVGEHGLRISIVDPNAFAKLETKNPDAAEAVQSLERSIGCTIPEKVKIELINLRNANNALEGRCQYLSEKLHAAQAGSNPSAAAIAAAILEAKRPGGLLDNGYQPKDRPERKIVNPPPRFP